MGIAMKYKIIVIACLAIDFPLCHCQDAQLKARPWHMVNTFATYSGSMEFETLEFDYQLLDDLQGVENVNSFFVVPMYGEINGIRFYFGFTSKDCPATINDKISNIESPCYRFTRFSQGGEETVQKSKNGYAHADNHEGDHAGVGIQSANVKGLYTLKLESHKHTPNNKDESSLIKIYVYNHNDKKLIHVGNVIFPRYPASVSKELGSFIETTQGFDRKKQRWNLPELEKSDEMPQFRIAVGNLMIDKKQRSAHEVVYYYRKDVPQKGNAILFNKTIADKLNSRLNRHDTLTLEISNDKKTRREETIVLHQDKESKTQVEAYFFRTKLFK
jgi:hypothetical protein